MIQRTHWDTGDELKGVELEAAFVALETAIGEGVGVGTGGAGALAQTATFTTSALGPGAKDATKTVVLGRAVLLSKVTTERAAWVRLYPTLADQSADLNRGRNDDPSEGITLALDFVTSAAQLSLATPNASVTHAAPSPTALFATVINLDGAAGTIAVTFDFLQLQPYEI